NALLDKLIEYRSFLRSLDNELFISHVKQVQLLQDNYKKSDSFELPAPKGISTPLNSSNHLISLLSSDPFNDGLDEVLLNVQQSLTAKNGSYVSDDLNDLTDEDSVGIIHEFGDYSTYFHNKHLKQQKADEEYVRWNKKRRGSQDDLTPIFEGCIIHVNGHTTPSINEIHRLVISYGGKFISYLTNKGAATHIICDKLTPRKRIEYKNYKVVRAQWIVDSVSKNRLLDWQNYRLIEEIEYGQKRLDFAAKVDAESLDDDLPLMTQHEPENELSQTSDDNHLAEHLPKDNSKDGKIMDAKNPEFLKHFFANSRLHHLSTWKADLRLKFLKRIVKEKKIKTNILEKKMILHIDFDCFFATASCLNFPNLNINTDPIAVTHGGRTSDVASCNYVARSYGVRNGMWMGRAKDLCPEIKTLPYDFDSYEKHSNEFYNYLLSYDIFDSIFPVLIDEALVDISTFALLPSEDPTQSIVELCRKIRADVFKLTSCTVSVGASHNVLLAKLALKKAKPDNQLILNENIAEFLKSTRVQDLPGIGRKIKEKLLAQLHKSSNDEPVIEDLLNFDKLKLMKIFGSKTGSKLFEYARGIDHTSIAIDTSSPESLLGRKSISVDVNFGIRFDSVEQVEVFLMRISKELYSRLISLGICGSHLTLRLAKRAPGAPINPEKYLGMGICEFISKSSRLGVATNDWGIIGSEAKALYRMINTPVKDLRGISLTITKLEDVDAIKKSRQSRLQFTTASVLEKNEDTRSELNDANKPIRSPVLGAPNVKRPSLDTVQGQIDVPDDPNIDWEVFNSLPWDIRREIKRELERRHLGPSRLPSPIKPRGKFKEGKGFLQQLIPSQSNSIPKYVRVIETPNRSPSKSPSKRQRTSALPVKQSKENSYNESDSYSNTILNELPSSIREEVLKDIEYKKKIKKFDLVPLRDKVAAKYEEHMPSTDSVTLKWLNQQEKRNPIPHFLNKEATFEQMKFNIDNWIRTSLLQQGPHRDDVSAFLGYVFSLLKSGNCTRGLLLIEHIKKVLSFHEAVNNVSQVSESKLFVTEGIKDWQHCLNLIMIPQINTY
ncbi:DNA repair protein, partial [Suhomyces tanzawaensis NRRL Y-17324]